MQTKTNLEVLKAEDVEHADRVETVVALEADVQLGDDPLEQLRVERHAERVARVRGLCEIECG